MLFRYSVVFLWGFVWTSILLSQEPSKLTIRGETKVEEVERHVVIKEKVTVVTKLPFTVEAPVGGVAYSWEFPSSIAASRTRNILTVTEGKGQVRVSVEWSTAELKAGNLVVTPFSAELLFYIGEVAPPPKPDPKPDPKPVVPVGFRVLLIHESQEKSPAFFDGRAVKEYLDSKTVKDEGHPSWRRLDKDQAGANLPKELKLLWEAAKPKITTVPAVVIAVNEQVTIHALPKDEQALLELLKKHGGE